MWDTKKKKTKRNDSSITCFNLYLIFFFFCITNFYIFTLLLFQFYWDIIVGTSSDDSMVRNPSQCRSHRECRFNLWVEKILWGGNGNPLQDSCQDNAMDRGAWWATVPGVTKGQTRLSDGADMHSCASSKEQPQRLREVTKSTMHRNFHPGTRYNYGKQKIDIMLHMKNSSK